MYCSPIVGTACARRPPSFSDERLEAVVAEFAIGLVIVGVTAAMVVSPPATSQSRGGAPSVDDTTALYYTP